MLLTTEAPIDAITALYDADEAACVKVLVEVGEFDTQAQKRIQIIATELMTAVRSARQDAGGLDAFMAQYDLSSAEGIALMCMAEALLRIPDKFTIDKLISDKISPANWKQHMGQSNFLFVNAATWGLMLTGKVLDESSLSRMNLKGALKNLARKNSAPTIRQVVLQSMRILGGQFVMAPNIVKGIARAAKRRPKGYSCSYDMLGEAALTEADAVRYHVAYLDAITSVGKASKQYDVYDSDGISIKLSALYPRYEYAHMDDVFEVLYPRIKEAAMLAKQYDVGLTIDAEEANRLEPSLAVIEKLAHDEDLAGWEGLGLAVQAYQKRAPEVLKWLAAVATSANRRFMVRLVKGAYWDTEIKHAQVEGFGGYPVFTRKVYTDVSYLTCARYMLEHTDAFYPQFATHNAHSLAAVLSLAGDYRDFEFQCLHGMGESLYDHVLAQHENLRCRIYAPVGDHKFLLAYLVRRLLENGANTSFVNRILDVNTPIEALIADPYLEAKDLGYVPHARIPLPKHLYQSEARMNSKGLNLDCTHSLNDLQKAVSSAVQTMPWQAQPLVADKLPKDLKSRQALNPALHTEVIGQVVQADAGVVTKAFDAAEKAFVKWQHEPLETRVHALEKMADLLEAQMGRFVAIAIYEAGKSYPNAIAEVREAVDFCRYYASEAKRLLSHPTALPGPTGETNHLSLHPRGIVVCVSPWNFPLAIFLGEVTAALAAGNVVLAKPASQTCIIAYEAMKLLHEAGFPRDVVQLLPGPGSSVGNALIQDARVRAVIFTGSNPTAASINQTLAAKKGPISVLIAETGGQNCMIADSSALPEQLVQDVVLSAFDSAGQRCSAMRVLFLQEDIADEVMAMIKGAMLQLKVGNPIHLSTDVGPVIDEGAQTVLLAHIERMHKEATSVFRLKASVQSGQGNFVLPTLVELDNLSILEEEVFGPVLHVIRFKGKDLDKVIDQINATGFGLTFGIHSRIQETINYVTSRIHAGNIYVNRNTVGAVVGVQPFGGEGLSGTGPKAGGPAYLPRLCVERTLTVDTTAAGGNASLLGLG
jgi:RHH-type proline utilization regulon transcriptional repressor/proline dehydrogenase/delta 1-pyrroline-5-carboxylate dehydrogenase